MIRGPPSRASAGNIRSTGQERIVPETKYIAIRADIGGRFTDVVVVDERTHAIHSAKVLTTPEYPERAVVEARRLSLA